jgi:hypothetical protein
METIIKTERAIPITMPIIKVFSYTWADTGIHFGLNVAYGLLNGMSGKPGNGIIVMHETGSESFLSTANQYVIPTVMFLFLLWVIRLFQTSQTSSFASKSLSL